jgi:tRNA wybutosine-synthesizing protein 3
MSFESKKEAILKRLEVSEEEYSDLSPKGSIDVAIQDLIHEINAIPSLVTTSSCSGRVAIYLEGQKSLESAGTTRKCGGRWLFVSHEQLDINESASSIYSLFRQDSELNDGSLKGTRFVHFKFEPMVWPHKTFRYDRD